MKDKNTKGRNNYDLETKDTQSMFPTTDAFNTVETDGPMLIGQVKTQGLELKGPNFMLQDGDSQSEEDDLEN